MRLQKPVFLVFLSLLLTLTACRTAIPTEQPTAAPEALSVSIREINKHGNVILEAALTEKFGR